MNRAEFRDSADLFARYGVAEVEVILASAKKQHAERKRQRGDAERTRHVDYVDAADGVISLAELCSRVEGQLVELRADLVEVCETADFSTSARAAAAAAPPEAPLVGVREGPGYVWECIAECDFHAAYAGIASVPNLYEPILKKDLKRGIFQFLATRIEVCCLDVLGLLLGDEKQVLNLVLSAKAEFLKSSTDDVRGVCAVCAAVRSACSAEIDLELDLLRRAGYDLGRTLQSIDSLPELAAAYVPDCGLSRAFAARARDLATCEVTKVITSVWDMCVRNSKSHSDFASALQAGLEETRKACEILCVVSVSEGVLSECEKFLRTRTDEEDLNLAYDVAKALKLHDFCAETRAKHVAVLAPQLAACGDDDSLFFQLAAHGGDFDSHADLSTAVWDLIAENVKARSGGDAFEALVFCECLRRVGQMDATYKLKFTLISQIRNFKEAALEEAISAKMAGKWALFGVEKRGDVFETPARTKLASAPRLELLPLNEEEETAGEGTPSAKQEKGGRNLVEGLLSWVNA